MSAKSAIPVSDKMDNPTTAVKLDQSELPVSTPSKRVIVESNYSVKKPKFLDLSKKKEKPGVHLKVAKPTTVKKPVQIAVGKPCPLPSDAPQKVGCANYRNLHSNLLHMHPNLTCKARSKSL